MLLGPLGSLILFGGIALGVKWLIATRLPDGWLRDQLLRERIPSKYSASNRRVLQQAVRRSRG
jgi:hypothetical protein